MSGEMWGFIFLMLMLKLPIVYLGIVVWYACKPPLPPQETTNVRVEATPPPHDLWRPWRARRLNPNPRPRDRHARRAPRASSAARAYARHE